MNNWQWKKKAALAEQLKFFGAKKQKFISIYAKKPKILVKAKESAEEMFLRIDKEQQKAIRDRVGMSPDHRQAAYLSSLYQQQVQIGINRSSIRYSQIAAAQQQMNMYRGQGSGLLDHIALSGLVGGNLHE